jgi:hypothetical protein
LAPHSASLIWPLRVSADSLGALASATTATAHRINFVFCTAHLLGRFDSGVEPELARPHV